MLFIWIETLLLYIYIIDLEKKIICIYFSPGRKNSWHPCVYIIQI